MLYTFTASKYFSLKFDTLDYQFKRAIIDFLNHYKQYGLNNLTGKLVPTYKQQDKLSEEYDFCFKNNLWHYHVGVPIYRLSKNGKYCTSLYLLHFSKVSNQEIKLLDILPHYTEDGKFLIPDIKTLF